jgi:hypothetical protein
VGSALTIMDLLLMIEAGFLNYLYIIASLLLALIYLVDKKIVYQDKTFYFKKGDEVIIGTVYHFTESQLKKICKMYFNSVEIIKDKSNSYVLVLCRK